MRSQVLAGIVAAGLLAVAPVSAAIVDFSTNPNLTTNWTQDYFYQGTGGTPAATAAWNASNQNLDLTANSEVLGRLFKTGDTRSATDGVTVTYSNYNGTAPTAAGKWTCAGLCVSANATPNIFDGSPWYGLYLQQDYSGTYFAVGNGTTTVGKYNLSSIPTTIKFDITRDGSNYVFKANGIEIGRNAALASTELSHYYMYWGASSSDTLSVSADNFGTVVPEPGTIALMVSALFGLLAYAWRKRN